jgi:hypothetical protein
MDTKYPYGLKIFTKNPSAEIEGILNNLLDNLFGKEDIFNPRRPLATDWQYEKRPEGEGYTKWFLFTCVADAVAFSLKVDEVPEIEGERFEIFDED